MSKSRYTDFIFWESDWLYRQFNRRLEFVRSHKYFTLKAALNMFLQNEGKLIVESGTQRMIDDPGGGSTLLFGAFCERYKKRLITVDNDPKNMETSKQATQEYKNYITYVLMDSVKFLSELNEEIDLLYLDSLDYPTPIHNRLQDIRLGLLDIKPSLEATQAQKHNLNELKAAYNKLHNGSILLIDDNNLEAGGKGMLSKKFLLETGEWHCILDSGQTLWIKVK